LYTLKICSILYHLYKLHIYFAEKIVFQVPSQSLLLNLSLAQKEEELFQDRSQRYFQNNLFFITKKPIKQSLMFPIKSSCFDKMKVNWLFVVE